MNTDVEFRTIHKREYAFEMDGRDCRCSLERVPRYVNGQKGGGYVRGVLAVFRNERGEQFFSQDFDRESYDHITPQQGKNIFLRAHETLMRCW